MYKLNSMTKIAISFDVRVNKMACIEQTKFRVPKGSGCNYKFVSLRFSFLFLSFEPNGSSEVG